MDVPTDPEPPRPASERGTRGWLCLLLLLAGGVLVVGAFAVDRLVPGSAAGFGSSQWGLLAAGLVALLAGVLCLQGKARKRVLLVLGSSLVSLLVVELLLRTLFAVHFGTIYAPDARYLHRHVPGSRKFFQRSSANGGQTIPIRINSEGYRGPELRSDSTTRVAVYGDSFIAAEYSAEEDTFVHRLGVELEARGLEDVEMVNGGVVAYGPDQILRRLEDEFPLLKPDLVVVTVLAENDFGDLVRNRLYRLGPEGELVERPQDDGEVLGDGILRTIEEARARPYVWQLYERWRSRRAGERDLAGEDLLKMDFLLRECRFEYEKCVIEDTLEGIDLFWDHYDADLSVHPGGEPARYKARLMEGILGAIGEEAARHGVPLLFVFLPSLIDVCDTADVGNVDRKRFDAYRPESKTDLLAGIATRNSIAFVNLWDLFRANAACELYWLADTHWNDRGQALAAEHVAGVLVEGGLFR